MKINIISFLIPAILFLPQLLNAQFTEFHPELDWYTIKGENVEVHYHDEAERTAKVVLKIAEEIWEPITSLYGYEPETVHFVIKDIDDYSNGATYFFNNKIEIWASALDFDLRGTHNWLRNVISHEFTHLVQIQASLKVSRNVPALYLQFLNYEDKRRPDILYGFPNFIATYPVSSINVPAWFAEGTAQYMRKEFNYDNWDSHRDMILRSYVLDGNMLTWNEMGVFGKTSLGNESVYNSGFALVNYIAKTYGEEKIPAINKALGKFSNITIDGAFEDVLGKNGNEIYSEWQDHLEKNYNEKVKDIRQNLVSGKIISQEGFGNFYPVFSKDGKSVFYISNRNSDYFTFPNLYKKDLQTGKDELIKTMIRSTVSFIPGENKIIYAKLSEDNPGSANLHDLYVYDLNSKKEKRITKELRANNPSVSNDGKKIAFIFQKDGTSNIGIVDIDGKNFKRLTFFENGEQVYNPKFSNDNNFIVFDFSNLQSRDIASVNSDGTNFSFILNSEIDERNPVFDKNGNLIYSSDETGIFNLYEYDFKTKNSKRITNVLGGAFMPGVDENGNIAYAGYTSKGYKIFFLENEHQKNVMPEKKYKIENETINENILASNSIPDLERLRNYDDTKIPNYDRKKYRGAFTKVSFFPLLRYDNYTTSPNIVDRIKPGLYVASDDMLDRFSFFAGASINKRMERDLFLTFNYRNKLPLLFDLGLKPELSFEIYNITRKANTDLLVGADTLDNGTINYDYQIPIDVDYSLLEADFVAKHRLFTRANNIEFRFILSRYTSTLGSFLFPGTMDQLVQKSKDTYLIGRNFQITLTHEFDFPYLNSDINPIGRKIELRYNYEMNKFNPDNNYEVEDGILKPIYKDFDFHRLELNLREHIKTWKDHTISGTFRAGTIFGPTIPDFFDFYLGGIIGMKAYPFYAISGNEVAWANLTYRFPLFKNIDKRFAFLYFDKIFLSVYGDLGNAWNGKTPALNDFKKGAGGELRFKLNSFYLFPTSIFFNAAYGFDKYVRDVRGEKIEYGKEWHFYGGILFDFSL